MIFTCVNLCVPHSAASKVLVAPVLIVLVVVIGALALVIGKNFFIHFFFLKNVFGIIKLKVTVLCTVLPFVFFKDRIEVNLLLVLKYPLLLIISPQVWLHSLFTTSVRSINTPMTWDAGCAETALHHTHFTHTTQRYGWSRELSGFCFFVPPHLPPRHRSLLRRGLCMKDLIQFTNRYVDETDASRESRAFYLHSF